MATNTPNIDLALRRIYDELDNMNESYAALEGLRDLFFFSNGEVPSARSTGNLIELLYDEYNTRLTGIMQQVQDALDSLK
jgi:hypothetical protein